MSVNSKLYISIAGLIGSGKSVLAEKLGKVFDLPVFYEPVQNNPYLENFYKDMGKYSFPLQIWLLNARFAQAQQLIWSEKGGINDRTIFEDKIFAGTLVKKGLMDPQDYQTYLDLFSNMANFMRKPTLLIYLKVSPEESMRRIKLRSRECEKGITLEYLQELYDEYEKFILQISKEINVVVIDWSKFIDETEVAERILEEYKTMTNIREIQFPAVGTAQAL